jgi:carbon monoxide dehydrogenase subunit G
MDLNGETIIPAPRQAVWDGLNDPEVLRQAIPGCQSIEKLSDTEFTAKVVAKVGPVKATFTGAVTLSELDPPNSYRIGGEGKGGVAGFAKGSALVTLTDAPEGGTKLAYTVDAQVGGKLAQIGSRLIEGSAKSLSAEFFNKFAELIQTPTDADVAEAIAEGIVPPPPPEIQSVPHEDEAAALDSAIADTRGLPPWIWIGSLILLIVLILALAIG